MFWRNKRKIDFSGVSSNSRRSQKAALKNVFVRICPDLHTFLCKFFTFLNACISVKASSINTKLGDFVNLGMLYVDQ